MFVKMHVHVFVGRGLCEGFWECLCLLLPEPGLKWILRTQPALKPRGPRKAEVDSRVLQAPEL